MRIHTFFFYYYCLPVASDLWTVVAIAIIHNGIHVISVSAALPINQNIATFHSNTTIWPCDTQCRSNTTFKSSEKKEGKKKKRLPTEIPKVNLQREKCEKWQSNEM